MNDFLISLLVNIVHFDLAGFEDEHMLGYVPLVEYDLAFWIFSLLRVAEERGERRGLDIGHHPNCTELLLLVV